MSSPLARLAGVTALGLKSRRGPREGFVFEPHRLALPCWGWALRDAPRPALLVTFDRHLDLVPPASPPPVGADVLALDAYARLQLDPRNLDHVLAAMHAGLVGDAIVLARARPEGCVAGDRWSDPSGRSHRLLLAPSLPRLLDGPLCGDALELLAQAKSTLLDFDLDCFTTPSDADPLSVVPWPLETIREQLLPQGSERFWDGVLANCRGLTFARESVHCGGMVAGDALFAQAAKVVFEELLGVDLP